MRPRGYPTPLARSAWKSARWLVIAPHADDETLGAGALIHEAAADDRLGGVVILTDGAGSHAPGEHGFTARLVSERRREACAALRSLAGRAACRPEFLDWPDAHPPAPGDPLWDRSLRRLAWTVRGRRIDAIAVTSLADAHCDHQAAARLARALVARALRPVALFEYHVWSHPDATARSGYASRPLRAGMRAGALARHRSQTSALFGPGFRLPREPSLAARSDRLYPVTVPHG
ncbi:PIG-L deacetylase family protein [Brevundimonas lutea]|uniref:PIG-L deacetylase family protein n=1 Tax=Brevundimonas lutea TaxID=2293980 RepID=UPI001F0C5CA3|nr:PIG-L family deacetylase [Brevundimonas lutea]